MSFLIFFKQFLTGGGLILGVVLFPSIMAVITTITNNTNTTTITNGTTSITNDNDSDNSDNSNDNDNNRPDPRGTVGRRRRSKA